MKFFLLLHLKGALSFAVDETRFFFVVAVRSGEDEKVFPLHHCLVRKHRKTTQYTKAKAKIEN